jgi:hypothetical protein
MSNFNEDDSVPIVLGDGQLWWFPKPWLQVRPHFENGKAVRATQILTYEPTVDLLVDAIAAIPAEDFEEQICAVATLAAYLLKWHYVLSDEDLDQLLNYRAGDAVSMVWTAMVVQVATGYSGPKRGSAGGG